MSERKIVNLYEHFKNSPKKLKIVCDWDEVIQACEPYSLFESIILEELKKEHGFSNFFKMFWEGEFGNKAKINYSPYGSKLNLKSGLGFNVEDNEKSQEEFKNSPNFYQQAPFLTIAEDLLKLIREGKVEQLIFLSAFDKRKFPNGDERKYKIFFETFGETFKEMKGTMDIHLELIPFDSELLEKADFHQTLDNKTKGQWIRENIPNVDIVIDDNPNICKSLIPSKDIANHPLNDGKKIIDDAFMIADILSEKGGEFIENKNITVISPYYPAVANQHDERVLLVKNEPSGLKKEDFK